MNLKNSFRTLFLGVVLSAAVSAQTNLAGRVVDAAGRPVPGATVVLKNKATAAERAVVTDPEGNFAFTGEPSAEFEVIVTSNGFGRIVRETGAGWDPTIVLSPAALTERVTVTATRTQILTDDTAVPVSVVDREAIDRAAVNTVGDIFRSLPGTSTVNEGAFQVRPRIRGLDSNRVLILIDGQRLNNSRTSTAQSGVELGLVDLPQVESVEVVRGSGSVLYGTDALGGTINIITRDTPPRRDTGFRFGGALNTFYSSNENGRRGSVSVNGSGKFLAFGLAQSLERFDNYSTGKPGPGDLEPLRLQGIGITDDGEVQNSQSHAAGSQATLRFFLNDTNTIKLNYERRRGANIGSSGLVGIFNGFFPFSNRDKFNARYDAAALTRNLQRLSINGFYQTQFRNFTNILTVPPAPPFFPGIYQFSETVTDTKTAALDLQTDWTFGKRNSLTAGASFFRDDNSDRRLGISASTPSSANRRFSTTRSVPDASLTNFAFFAQDDFRVTDRLKLTGGIRFDNFRIAAQPTTGFALPILRPDQINDLGIGGLAGGLNVTRNAVTGDFGAVFRATRNVNLSARVGRSFRTPNIFEIFFTDTGSVGGFVVGNSRLKPESGTNFDTSVKFRTSRFSGSLTYFNNSYKDFIATPAANDSRGCPIFIVQPGTVYDASNCNIVSSPPGRSPVRVFQTQNIARARIQGFEAEFEAPIKIRVGYLTPNGNFSYLRGDDTDRNVPLDVISPFRTNVGFRWQNFGKSYFMNFNARFVARQNRLSPAFLRPLNQGGNGGPEAGFATYDANGGYYFRRERFNFSVNLGVSNIANRFYSEQFVFAPARGRSLTIGTNWEIK